MEAPFALMLATGNPHKAKELEALLSDWSVELHTARDLQEPPVVVEDADTLEGNARKKAVEWFEAVDTAVLADDTGLEVKALDGRPGVHSARFAGPAADDAANRAALLTALQGKADRAAQFRTVLAFNDGTSVRLFEGICRGRLLTEERGTRGFGYDALFVPAGYERTFAELPPDEKNRISHRGRALESFVAFLRTYPPAASARP
ncbi:MAG: RdgB/HAM1 family non-canonical purine NTP pyrophosphatase [Bacteroidetes bacterium]|jgi:XTP/dITP diphosphohydrolase|nr:RdgB/HAM1 family non-canonical purine NTP pyrophosphatase [Bacteroidota bacterium]